VRAGRRDDERAVGKDDREAEDAVDGEAELGGEDGVATPQDEPATGAHCRRAAANDGVACRVDLRKDLSPGYAAPDANGRDTGGAFAGAKAWVDKDVLQEQQQKQQRDRRQGERVKCKGSAARRAPLSLVRMSPPPLSLTLKRRIQIRRALGAVLRPWYSCPELLIATRMLCTVAKASVVMTSATEVTATA
jgi:hypothetical protein